MRRIDTDQLALNKDLVLADFPLDVASSVLDFNFKNIHGVLRYFQYISL
jgi:hypothetical protein